MVLAGSLVYCALMVAAALSYTRRKTSADSQAAPISVLKPLSGVDEGLEANLCSFFEQDFLEFEILFAVRTAGDAAVPVVQRLQACHPDVRSQLIVTGE